MIEGERGLEKVGLIVSGIAASVVSKTVFANTALPRSTRIMTVESFADILAADADLEAIRLSSDTPYGLQEKDISGTRKSYRRQTKHPSLDPC